MSEISTVSTVPRQVEFECIPCSKLFDDTQVEKLRVGGGHLYACPQCKRHVRAIVTSQPEEYRDNTVSSMFLRSFILTLENGFITSSVGLAISCVFLNYLINDLFAASVIASYFFVVLQAFAKGESNAPHMADFRHQTDMLVWVLRLFLPLAVAFAPFAVVHKLLNYELPAMFLRLVCLLIGTAYVPAGFIIAAFNPVYHALNPIPAVRLAIQMGKHYFTLVGVAMCFTIGLLMTEQVFALLNVFHPRAYLVAEMGRWWFASYIAITAARFFGSVLNTYEHNG